MSGNLRLKCTGIAAGGGSDQVDLDDEDEIPAAAKRLRAIVGQITPEEFRWQEANYDRDSLHRPRTAVSYRQQRVGARHVRNDRFNTIRRRGHHG